jgi:hypothetical protein
VFRSIQGPGIRSRIFTAAAVAVAAVGLTACAATGGAPAAAPAKTVTETAQASPVPAGSSHQAAPGASASESPASSSAGNLPDYQPSTAVNRSEYSIVLTSPDSVSKIGEFYRNALVTGGWHVTSSSLSAYHASFAAYRGNQGVSVSVYSRGSGSGISISTHPQ